MMTEKPSAADDTCPICLKPLYVAEATGERACSDPMCRWVQRLDAEAATRLYGDMQRTYDDAKRRVRELDEELPYIRAGKPLPPEFVQRASVRRREQFEFYSGYVAPAMDALVRRVRAGTDTAEDRRILAACGVSRESIQSDT